MGAGTGCRRTRSPRRGCTGLLHLQDRHRKPQGGQERVAPQLLPQPREHDAGVLASFEGYFPPARLENHCLALKKQSKTSTSLPSSTLATQTAKSRRRLVLLTDTKAASDDT